ncbi:LPS export ABC transporter periplasmic protein LptC [Candidatus Pelagibacter communis]|uniref:LPS export ABC transporter periplasmic protein LptC n=1 Tax=Pelagibacter ubique TaxID=198252 RepID=UPI00065B3667|nr:LPS export ABC transporter periplasmic protein LptC [Candidatus Pelagibacter ubique]
MYKKKIVRIIFSSLIIALVGILTYSKFYKKNNNLSLKEKNNEETKYNSNIIKDVEYTTKDENGNEYLVKALEGEIDLREPNIIYLTKVYALIKIVDSGDVKIVSDYGKYNSLDFDTIFSKNVTINYLDNQIKSEYLDFSLKRNLMSISRNVIYKNQNNTLKADAVELNIKTKDAKIFMYEKEKKVNLINKN